MEEPSSSICQPESLAPHWCRRSSRRTIPLESKSPSWEESPPPPPPHPPIHRTSSNQPASQLSAHSVTPSLVHLLTRSCGASSLLWYLPALWRRALGDRWAMQCRVTRNETKTRPRPPSPRITSEYHHPVKGPCSPQPASSRPLARCHIDTVCFCNTQTTLGSPGAFCLESLLIDTPTPFHARFRFLGSPSRLSPFPSITGHASLPICPLIHPGIKTAWPGSFDGSTSPSSIRLSSPRCKALTRPKP